VINFASFGNLVFERGDEESLPSFRARVRDAVAELGGGVLAWGAPEGLEWIEAAPEVIVVKGGIAEDASGEFAQFGDTLVERAPEESIEDFQIRARNAARAAGVGFVTFGGLPRMNYDDEATKGE
jgi:hypothetical protein